MSQHPQDHQRILDAEERAKSAYEVIQKIRQRGRKEPGDVFLFEDMLRAIVEWADSIVFETIEGEDGLENRMTVSLETYGLLIAGLTVAYTNAELSGYTPEEFIEHARPELEEVPFGHH